MMLSINSTQNSYNPAFRANVPNTIGKKACDRLAKQLLEYGNLKEQNLAQKYFDSINKIKAEKEIDEVLLCSTNKASSRPYISADGYHVHCFEPETLTKEMSPSERKTMMLMDCVNYVADTIKNVVIETQAF